MKTHTIVLNSRPNAKRRWPGPGLLAARCSDDETATQHCCIGCEGLARGVAVQDMMGCMFPPSGVGGREWSGIWRRTPTDEVAERVEAAVKLGGLDCSGYGNDYGAIAAWLNDDIAPDDPEAAVAGIRILFRALGETQGERWIVRWLR